MRRFIPSPAMIVAFVALVVALSGSAYAALKIGTASIKDNAVTAKKIAPKAMVDDFSFSGLSVGQTRVEDFGPFKTRYKCYTNESGELVASLFEIVPDSPITVVYERDSDPGDRASQWEEMVPAAPPLDGRPLGFTNSFAGETVAAFSRVEATVRASSSSSFLIGASTETTGTPPQCSLVAKVLTGK